MDIRNFKSQHNDYEFEFNTHGILCFKNATRRLDSTLKLKEGFTLTFRLFNSSMISVELNFASCNRGEVLNELRRCVPCEPNLFSFSENFETQSLCVKAELSRDHFVSFGGMNLIPDNGYWRYSQDSTEILKCPLTSACTHKDLVIKKYKRKLINCFITDICH
jgi:hypothetical protein